MKSLLLLTALFISSMVVAIENNPKFGTETIQYNSDSTKAFVLEKKGKQIFIQEGRQVFVKADYFKYKGALKVLNDSTIQVGKDSVRVADIDMITNRKTGKTIGLIFASLPVHFGGFLVFAFGYDIPVIAGIGGAMIAGGGVTAVVLEAKRGKRYHAYSLGFNKGTINRKWNYSIQQ